jgi:23S rRNA pseudouridine1911/1915/1917 synthase
MNHDSGPASPDRLRLEATVPIDLAGSRVDRAAAEVFAGYSRARITGWLKSGELTIDGRAWKPSEPVAGGERLVLDALIQAHTGSAAEPIALDIIHEDRDVLVIAKPAGLVVHPGAGNPDGTLENALLHHDAKLAALPRAGIVHRLDKETSGVMMVARTLKAHAALVAALAAREVHRQYEAVVHGTIVAGDTIDAPIGRHPADRLRQAVRDEEAGGRSATTHYRVRERFRAHTRVECRLETGRTHQIRVHMAHIRHPLVGDPLYGGGLKLPKGAGPGLIEVLRGFRRQALHAERIEFAHPRTGKPVVAEAPRPADLARLIEALRADARAHAP